MSEIPKWKIACHCAVSDGVPRRSFYVALVVGTILNPHQPGRRHLRCWMGRLGENHTDLFRTLRGMHLRCRLRPSKAGQARHDRRSDAMTAVRKETVMTQRIHGD